MQLRISHVALVFLPLAILTLLSCTRPIAEAPGEDRSDLSSTTTTVNINRATVQELERLPGIGPGLAERIVRHRERFGPFRRVEQLMLIDGVGDKRFRKIRHLLTVD